MDLAGIARRRRTISALFAALDAPGDPGAWGCFLRTVAALPREEQANLAQIALELHNERTAMDERCKLRCMARRIGRALGDDSVVRIADLMAGLDWLRAREIAYRRGPHEPILFRA